MTALFDFRVLFLVAFSAGITPEIVAQQPTKKASQAVASAPSTVAVTNALVYKPPRRGAPKVRVNAGSRGSDDKTASLFVLAPDHVGLTSKPKPTLFWFQSRPGKARLEVTIVVDKQPRPILEIILNTNTPAGIGRLDLAAQGITLQPQIQYKWLVALVPDPDNRSKDIVASGMIELASSGTAIADRVAKVMDNERASAYAQEGIWYDAVESLVNLRDAHPENPDYPQKLSNLLRQVGLDEVAVNTRK